MTFYLKKEKDMVIYVFHDLTYLDIVVYVDIMGYTCILLCNIAKVQQGKCIYH